MRGVEKNVLTLGLVVSQDTLVLNGHKDSRTMYAVTVPHSTCSRVKVEEVRMSAER